MSEARVFKDVNFNELRHIYEEILKGREEGLRPKCLDVYIEKVRTVYPALSFGEAWKYTESLFWDEVGKRYFAMSGEIL